MFDHRTSTAFTPQAEPSSSRSLQNALETARNRVLIGILCFLFLLTVLGIRLFTVMVMVEPLELTTVLNEPTGYHLGRSEIVDRHGNVLATSIPTSSLYANATKVHDAHAALKKLLTVLPTLSPQKTLEKLTSGKQFIWIARHLTPKQEKAILQLGIPGLDFHRDQRRIYPLATLFAHVVGMTNVDNEGVSGVEKTFEQQLMSQQDPLRLSLDRSLQYLVHRTLTEGLAEFEATGAAAIVMDLQTSEVLAMVSLPDFNPNQPPHGDAPELFNKSTLGIYEMGSTMKIANTAMALETGAAQLSTVFDTGKPLQIGRFQITDYRASHGLINVAQIFVYSSNRGSARMALAAGIEKQKEFLRRLGFLSPVSIELPEHGRPMVPRHWREANSITISYGYGIAVTPLHLLNAVATMIGGGCRKQATLLKRDPATLLSKPCERVVSTKTSQTMLDLMRLVVLHGTGKKANVPGYFVGIKTGTRNLLMNGRYQTDRVATSAVGVIGKDRDHPRYMIGLILEDPKRSKKTYGFNTSGWNAAPIAGRIMGQVAAYMGLKPSHQPDEPKDPFLRTVSFKEH